MSDYAEMADGPMEPTQPAAQPEPPKREPPVWWEPPYIRYTPWEPPPKTGPELAQLEVADLRKQVADMQAGMQKMQEAICHLELQVSRLLNQEGEL